MISVLTIAFAIAMKRTDAMANATAIRADEPDLVSVDNKVVVNVISAAAAVAVVADDDDLAISFLVAMAIAIASAIDGAAVAGFAAVFLVDAARNVEADATAIVSAVCCVRRCVNSDAKGKISN